MGLRGAGQGWRRAPSVFISLEEVCRAVALLASSLLVMNDRAAPNVLEGGERLNFSSSGTALLFLQQKSTRRGLGRT
jgi:hypothetical protein